MTTPPNPSSVPSKENLKLLLDQHGDQLQELQRAVDGGSTTSPEFKKTIQWLLLSTILYVRCLYDWFDEHEWPMQFLGWAARNLFELEIWTRYVLKKREYAERFAKDWILDGIGIGKSIQSWGSSRGMPDMGINHFLQELNTRRDKELPGAQRFLDARHYLVELEMKKRHDQLNPLFSKLVHPTSWSVHWKHELLDKTNMRLFIITIGTQSSMNITSLIRDHMCINGLEPLN